MRTDSVVFEITDREIRALRFLVPPFRKSLRNSAKVKFDCIPIPTGIIEQGNVRDQNALINLLRIYASKYSGKSSKSYLAVPLQQGFIRAYHLPWLPRRDRKSAISLLADEEISVAKSDILYDYYVLEEERHNSLEVLLGAARQNLLEEYVLIFEHAGFKVMGIDFALSVLGQALGFKRQEDVLYLQGDVEGLQIALFRGKIPESVRTLQSPQIHLPLVKESWSNGQAQMTELGNEISRFLLYYRTQHPDLKLSRLVWRGYVISEQLAQWMLMTNQVLEVEQAKISKASDFCRNVLEENQGYCEVVIGYALRIIGNSPGLNFCRQANLAKMAMRKLQGLAGLSAALSLLGAILWFLLVQITSPLQNEVAGLSRQGAKIEAEVRHQEDLELAWNKLKVNSEKIGKGLAQIQALSGSGLKITRVTYKQGSISLSGSAIEPMEVQSLLNTLRNYGWIQPVLTSYKSNSLDNVEFSISAKQGHLGKNNTPVP